MTKRNIQVEAIGTTRTIKYESDGLRCTTPCPERKLSKVGTLGCAKCKLHLSHDKEKQIVKCIHVHVIPLPYGERDMKQIIMIKTNTKHTKKKVDVLLTERGFIVGDHKEHDNVTMVYKIKHDVTMTKTTIQHILGDLDLGYWETTIVTGKKVIEEILIEKQKVITISIKCWEQDRPDAFRLLHEEGFKVGLRGNCDIVVSRYTYEEQTTKKAIDVITTILDHSHIAFEIEDKDKLSKKESKVWDYITAGIIIALLVYGTIINITKEPSTNTPSNSTIQDTISTHIP